MAENMKDNGLGNILWKIITREKLQVKCNCYGEKIFRFQVWKEIIVSQIERWTSSVYHIANRKNKEVFFFFWLEHMYKYSTRIPKIHGESTSWMETLILFSNQCCLQSPVRRNFYKNTLKYGVPYFERKTNYPLWICPLCYKLLGHDKAKQLILSSFEAVLALVIAIVGED